jgi:hypothetical protein
MVHDRKTLEDAHDYLREIITQQEPEPSVWLLADFGRVCLDLIKLEEGEK